MKVIRNEVVRVGLISRSSKSVVRSVRGSVSESFLSLATQKEGQDGWTDGRIRAGSLEHGNGRLGRHRYRGSQRWSGVPRDRGYAGKSSEGNVLARITSLPSFSLSGHHPHRRRRQISSSNTNNISLIRSSPVTSTAASTTTSTFDVDIDSVPIALTDSLLNSSASGTGSPSISLLLAAFIGLPAVLWGYKCLMLVLFQRKIIYMGYLPPGSRSEKLVIDEGDDRQVSISVGESGSDTGVVRGASSGSDSNGKKKRRDPDLDGLECEELELKNQEDERVVLRGYAFRRSRSDAVEGGTRLSGGGGGGGAMKMKEDESQLGNNVKRVVLVYFQGNVGSPIQRLPLFRKLLLQPDLLHPHPPPSQIYSPLKRSEHKHNLLPIDLTIIAIPPRSYGLSTNKSPSQFGMLRDYRAILKMVEERYVTPSVTTAQKVNLDVTGEGGDVAVNEKREKDDRPSIIWMGHSLGASISAVLLEFDKSLPCDGLIYENGFASIPDMVRELYPHRFLPYRYLGRFAWDTWDAQGAFERMAVDEKQVGRRRMHSCDDVSDITERKLPVLFLSSSQDELVPPAMVKRAFEGTSRPDSSAFDPKFVSIQGALHDFGFQKQQWGREIVRFLQDVVSSEGRFIQTTK